jgi:hypothetical protein
MSSQKKRTLLSAKEKVWVVNCYNELQFNNYDNLFINNVFHFFEYNLTLSI